MTGAVDWVTNGTMMKKRLLALGPLLLSAGFICGQAQAAEHLSDHEEFCRTAPDAACLTFLQQQLGSVTPHSRPWYKLMSYQLDYLYDKQEFSELLQQTEQLLQQPALPPVFRTQLYFYHAKMLKSFGRMTQARHYADLAYQQLSSMYQAFADPLRVLELANLQTVFGEHDKAWALLLSAEHRFSKSKDPVFGFELNSNKALVQHAKGQLEEAAYSRKLALDAILPSGQNGKIIVAYGNLARTYQLLGQFGLAADYYEKSLPYMRPVTDEVQQATHLLRLAELSGQLQDANTGLAYLQRVDAKVLGQHHLELYQQLQQQFRPAQQQKSR